MAPDAGPHSEGRRLIMDDSRYREALNGGRIGPRFPSAILPGGSPVRISRPPSVFINDEIAQLHRPASAQGHTSACCGLSRIQAPPAINRDARGGVRILSALRVLI